jgi:hypothetical protein
MELASYKLPECDRLADLHAHDVTGEHEPTRRLITQQFGLHRPSGDVFPSEPLTTLKRASAAGTRPPRTRKPRA